MKIVKGKNSVVNIEMIEEGRAFSIVMENAFGEIVNTTISVNLFNKMVEAAKELENEHGQEFSNRIGVG